MDNSKMFEPTFMARIANLIAKRVHIDFEKPKDDVLEYYTQESR